jgi:hypothetical protein
MLGDLSVTFAEGRDAFPGAEPPDPHDLWLRPGFSLVAWDRAPNYGDLRLGLVPQLGGPSPRSSAACGCGQRRHFWPMAPASCG